jgi:hypothetical protein
VRVAALAAGASGFTFGPDIGIAVGPGEPVPERLLTHELVHAAQQQSIGQVTPEQAEQQARHIDSGFGPDAHLLGTGGTGGTYVAYAATDWLQTTPNIRQYGYSELLDELTEVEEWLSRQIVSSPDADRMEEAKAALTAEIGRRQGAMQAPDRSRRRGGARRGRAASPEELPPQTQMPRVLGERTSSRLTDPDEIRTEVDRITAWLQRPDLSRDDRSILRQELATLAPSLGAGLAQASAERRQARLAQALAPGGSGDRAAVLANLRTIEAIRPYQEQPGMVYVVHDGELLVFPQALADQARAETVMALRDAARRAREMNDSSQFRMNEHMRLNYEEQPYVGFVVSLRSGEDPVDVLSRMLDPLADSKIALSRFGRALEGGSLTEMGEAVFTAVEKADQAQQIVLLGVRLAEDAAGSVVQGLTITRNLAFAVALSIAAIVAAPVVAGGVAGLGATGLLATGLTALGTSAVVGTGGFALGFAGGAGGELLAGSGGDRALSAGLEEGIRVGGQGAAIGLGGGATLGLARNLGLGAEGLSLGQNLWRGALAQGTGSGLGGAASGLVMPREGMGRGESALRGGLTGFGLGAFGGTAGAYARTLGSPVAQYAVGVGAPSVAAGGVSYLQTGGDWSQALQSGGLALTVGTLGQLRAGLGRTPGENRAFALGASARQTGRAYALAAGLGLFSASAAFRMGSSSGSYTLSDPRTSVSLGAPSAAQQAPVQEAAVQQAPVQQAAVQQAPVQQAAVQQAPVQQAAVQQAPVQQAAVQQAPVQQAPVQQAATQQVTQGAQDEASFAGMISSSAPSQPLRSAPIAAYEASSFFSVPVLTGSHASSPRVRTEAGVTGQQFESAHILAQTIGAAINRVLPGRYSAGRALAVLLPPQVHRTFDQGWVSLWNQRVQSGQRTTVNDARNLLRDAINGIPANLMTHAEKGALMLALDHQLFQTLDLSPDLVLFGGP